MIITEISTRERLEDYEIRSEYGAETLKYEIAAALVAARKRENLTQIALAKIAGVSQAYIAKLESGEANPTIGHVGAVFASIWLKAHINLVPLITPKRQEDVSSALPSLSISRSGGIAPSTANDIQGARISHASALTQPGSPTDFNQYEYTGAVNAAS
jgi:transcriptional regulator with XRE-family HTH domain